MQKKRRSIALLSVIACTLLVGLLTVACTEDPPLVDPTEAPTTEADTPNLPTEEDTTAEEPTEDPSDESTTAEELTEEITTEQVTTEEATTDEVTTEEATTEEITTEEVTTHPWVKPDSIIQPVRPAFGETICVANQKVADYSANYTLCCSVKYDNGTDIYAPLPLILEWEDVGADCYRVRLATNPQFTDSKVVLTADHTVSFNNPLTDTVYFWQVEALYEDHTDTSAIFTFRTSKTIRTVYIDGVTSTRDAGGYYVSETQRMKLGMVYRTAFLNNITPLGLYQAREELGIRAELDIRAPGDNGAGEGSPLGDDIRYYNISGVMYGSIYGAAARERIAGEIKVFADPDNYPLLVHCSLGRDRTGTIVMLIQALCGVSEMDIYSNYELCMFSEYRDATKVETLINNNFKPTVDHLKTFGKPTLKENAEAYMLSIGVTKEEIESIRSILIEEVK